MVRAFWRATALASMWSATVGTAQTPNDTEFLNFPMVYQVSAAKAPMVSWLIHQGSETRIRIARGPDFKPIDLYRRSDGDGQPVTRIQISPDGKQIAFVTGTAIGGRDDGYNPAGLLAPPKATIWLIEARDGAKPIKVGIGTDPSFTPDSRDILYRRSGEIWSASVAAPEKPALMLPSIGIGQFMWSRDGASMYFAQSRGGSTALGRYDRGNDRINWLVVSGDRISNIALSPDEKTIAYYRWPAREYGVVYDEFENEPFSLETVDIVSKATRRLWQSPNAAGVRILDDDAADSLRWSDDRTLVFRAEPDGWARLYAVPASGGAIRALTLPNCEVAESELIEPDVLLAIHNCGDLDRRQLSSIRVSTGKEQRISSADPVMANAAASNGRWVAFSGAGTDEPAMLRILDMTTFKTIPIERATDYGYDYHFRSPAPQEVHFKAADGMPVSGQLFLPSGKGPHPALIYAHGGPNRQMFPAFHFHSYYGYTYAMNRRLAELGYVVLSVNYRAGIGYGKAVREAPGRGWRGASEYQDILGAAALLIGRPDVDRKRIGMWGGSYGGLLTGQALARNSDIFAAGVAVHGMFDWTMLSSIPGHLNGSKFFGVGSRDRDIALRSSPIGMIDRWKSPVLLFSGDQDMNVDILQSTDLSRKLRDRGIEVKTQIIPGEAHTFIRHETWLRLWDDEVRFFDAKLRGKNEITSIRSIDRGELPAQRVNSRGQP